MPARITSSASLLSAAAIDFSRHGTEEMATAAHDSATAIDVARGLPQLLTFVIGNSMLDTRLEGDPNRLCNKGVVHAVRSACAKLSLIGAANAAATRAPLGTEISFVLTMKRDALGTRIREPRVNNRDPSKQTFSLEETRGCWFPSGVAPLELAELSAPQNSTIQWTK